MTTPAPFLSRHLGDYLLVAQLSEDSLGIVYRALYAADERHFVRLRILQSDELSPHAIDRAIREHDLTRPLAHDAIVARPQFDSVDGIPYLTWDETAGWTLDIMLSRVRALGIRIPAEYALLIVERIAAALEHTQLSAGDGRAADHGLLWPGFVSISNDAAVRIGGFGVAEAVLPSLDAPQLLAEIGPYVAPEVRSAGLVGSNSDVYSMGAILIELLTGRRPSLDMPSAELRAGDPRSDELESFLRKCLAPAETRFASAVDAHRAIQQMVTGNPFSLYTANLSLFLYKLLNPESQIVASASDLESTNPVVVQRTAPELPPLTLPATAPVPVPVSMPVAEDDPPPLPGTPRRRRGDLPESEVFANEVALSEPPPAATRIAVVPAAEAVALADSADNSDGEDSLAEARRRAWPPLPALARAWARPAATLAAAAAVAVGAFFIASQVQTIRHEAAPARVAIETPAAPVPSVEPASLPFEMAAPAAPVSAAASAPAAAKSAPARPARRPKPEMRRPAEELRLRAALARIEADRINAREGAAEIFVEGRSSEEEGERFLKERDYDAAQLAFSRAARLFQQAQDQTWEERVRQTNLDSGK